MGGARTPSTPAERDTKESKEEEQRQWARKNREYLNNISEEIAKDPNKKPLYHFVPVNKPHDPAKKPPGTPDDVMTLGCGYIDDHQKLGPGTYKMQDPDDPEAKVSPFYYTIDDAGKITVSWAPPEERPEGYSEGLFKRGLKSLIGTRGIMDEKQWKEAITGAVRLAILNGATDVYLNFPDVDSVDRKGLEWFMTELAKDYPQVRFHPGTGARESLTNPKTTATKLLDKAALNPEDASAFGGRMLDAEKQSAERYSNYQNKPEVYAARRKGEYDYQREELGKDKLPPKGAPGAPPPAGEERREYFSKLEKEIDDKPNPSERLAAAEAQVAKLEERIRKVEEIRGVLTKDHDELVGFINKATTPEQLDNYAERLRLTDASRKSFGAALDSELVDLKERREKLERKINELAPSGPPPAALPTAPAPTAAEVKAHEEAVKKHAKGEDLRAKLAEPAMVKKVLGAEKVADPAAPGGRPPADMADVNRDNSAKVTRAIDEKRAEIAARAAPARP